MTDNNITGAYEIGRYGKVTKNAYFPETLFLYAYEDSLLVCDLEAVEFHVKLKFATRPDFFKNNQSVNKIEIVLTGVDSFLILYANNSTDMVEYKKLK